MWEYCETYCNEFWVLSIWVLSPLSFFPSGRTIRKLCIYNTILLDTHCAKFSILSLISNKANGFYECMKLCNNGVICMSWIFWLFPQYFVYTYVWVEGVLMCRCRSIYFEKTDLNLIIILQKKVSSVKF